MTDMLNEPLIHFSVWFLEITNKILREDKKDISL